MLDKHKLRRLAELKLIEILVSLKYYVDVWPRAKVFANLLSMLKPIKTDQIKSRKTTPQAELTLPHVDIYL